MKPEAEILCMLKKLGAKYICTATDRRQKAPSLTADRAEQLTVVKLIIYISEAQFSGFPSCVHKPDYLWFYLIHI